MRVKVYKFFSPEVVEVATDALTTAFKSFLRGEHINDKIESVIRTKSLDSDVYLAEPADVDRLHAGKSFHGKNMSPFTLATLMLFDAVLLSWNVTELVVLRVPREPSFSAVLTSDCTHSRFGRPLRLVF